MSRGQAAVTFTVNVPQTAPGSRGPLTGTPGLASVVFQLTHVALASGSYASALPGAIVLPVTYGSPNCAAVAGGSTCTLIVNAPAAATDIWRISTYSSATPNLETDTPLSVYSGYVLPVTPGGPNVGSIATSGTPASLAFSPTSATLTAGVAAQLATAVQVRDANGAALVGGQYPIVNGKAGYVAFSGCGAGLVATPSTFDATSPAELATDGLSIAYDGLAPAGTILCHATAAGGLSATYTVTLTPAT